MLPDRSTVYRPECNLPPNLDQQLVPGPNNILRRHRNDIQRRKGRRWIAKKIHPVDRQLLAHRICNHQLKLGGRIQRQPSLNIQLSLLLLLR